MVLHPVSLATPIIIIIKGSIISKLIWLVMQIIQDIMIIKYLVIRFRIIRIFIMIIHSRSSRSKSVSIFMKIIVDILA